MATTLIIKCAKCANLMLAGENQKTRTCPYCGMQVNLEKAQKMAIVDNAFYASEILKKLKTEEGFS